MSDDNPYRSPNDGPMDQPNTRTPFALPAGRSDTMEITVEIGEDDIVALNEHVTRTLPAIRRRMLILWLLMPALLGAISALWYAQGEEKAALVVLLAAVFLFGLFLRLTRMARRRGVRLLLRSGSNLSMFGPQQIRITPNEIARHNSYGHAAYYWSAVDRIEVGDQHAFVFVSSMTAIAIPKRDLDPSTFDQFVGTAREYLHCADQQRTIAASGIHAASP